MIAITSGRLATSILAVLLPIFAARRTTSLVSAVSLSQSQSHCTTDTSVVNVSLRQLSALVEATATENPVEVAHREQLGLDGASMSAVTVVVNDSLCNAARIAYVRGTFPDTLDITAGLNSLPSVALIKVLPNRYLVNAEVLGYWTLYEHFVMDSTFAIVSKTF